MSKTNKLFMMESGRSEKVSLGISLLQRQKMDETKVRSTLVKDSSVNGNLVRGLKSLANKNHHTKSQSSVSVQSGSSQNKKSQDPYRSTVSLLPKRDNNRDNTSHISTSSTRLISGSSSSQVSGRTITPTRLI